MVTRDRFPELVSKADTSGEVVIMVEGPPRLAPEVEEFLQKIQNIYPRLNELELEITKIINIQEDILRARTRESLAEPEIECLKGIVHALAEGIRESFRELLAHLDSTSASWATTETTLNIVKEQHSLITKRFKEIWIKYQICQVQFEEEKEQFLKDYIVITQDEIIQSNDLNIESGNVMMMSPLSSSNDDFVEQRHNNFLQLEQSITGLAKIFIDMLELIDEQDDKLQAIIHKTSQAELHISIGSQELEKAASYKLQITKKTTWILVFAIAVVSLLAAVGGLIVYTQQTTT